MVLQERENSEVVHYVANRSIDTLGLLSDGFSL
ncbi:hypothetical protein CTO_1003 [Chlamydia trachomatis A2497]|uniref:Uncharacterized protein n=1 Tax=Chlamydia trachomatis serovar A (strain A2497) TaxID=580047 RepID=G4NNP2_CHLT4|nr:hypothetical protein CTO_1003 [Chlamydia trachomatis A2497]